MLDGSFLKELVGKIRQPHKIEVNGQEYLLTPQGEEGWFVQGGLLGWGPNGMFSKEPSIGSMFFSTLDSVVSYVLKCPDGTPPGGFMVIVEDHTDIRVVGTLTVDSSQRHVYAIAQMPPNEEAFPFSKWLDADEFVQMVQTYFTDGEDLVDLLKWTSSLQTAAVMTQTDDGVTQTVCVKKGTSFSERTSIRARLKLFPRGRTFPEVGPLPLDVVFRVKGGSEGTRPMCALFSCAPSEWRALACAEIATWLRDKLGDAARVI